MLLAVKNNDGVNIEMFLTINCTLAGYLFIAHWSTVILVRTQA